MLGILDNLGADTGKNIAVGIGTFIMTAVIIGVPIITVLSFIFNWPGFIKLVTTLASVVIFTVLWTIMIDGCCD